MPRKPKIVKAADGQYDGDVRAGMKRPRAITAAVDKTKGRMARVAQGAGGFGMRNRSAGMMIDVIDQSAPYVSGYKLDTYRSSYASGLGDRTGSYDVPIYFNMMNQQNGGILYWPVTLSEKYSWYRYWSRTDAYIGRALELLSDLPMSKLTLNMPKMPKSKRKLQKEIKDFFQYQLERIDLFELCQSILWEHNCIGNSYVFMEWDEKMKMWGRAVMLPPEEVYVFQYPFSENKRVEYRPQRLIKIIQDGIVAGESSSVPGSELSRQNLEQEILEHIPQELVDMVKNHGCIVMDTDPMTGSFVHHIARRKAPYMDLGASVLERVLVPMLQKEHYKYVQLSVASRNMTPKNLITAPGLMPEEVDNLRTQVDLSYMDPEYSIITNYDVNWQQIGASERMIDLDREYERIDAQVCAALGVTKELLTGEGAFGGAKITVEILNTMFMMTREILKNFIEKKLFLPVCEAHGWYDTDGNGIKHYWYPNVGFNRLTIRDNAEVFESLFQLYQKGSLPVDILYELFNLNSEEIEAKLRSEMFTVKDATTNRMIEEVQSEIGRKLTDRTDVVERVIKYLGLSLKPEEGEGEGYGETGFGDMMDLETEAQPEEQPEEQTEESTEEGPETPVSVNETESVLPPVRDDDDPDDLAETIVKHLPVGADAEDIGRVVDRISEMKDEKDSE